MQKGGRKRAGGKWLVQRHGSGNKRNADQAERAIEKRERQLGRREIAEQRREVED